ncbi:MAG: N-acetyl-gamma-glutamyl-phosphate reductase [Ilumatobacteraceae bacterium]
MVAHAPVRAGIIGASGFTGAELLRLVAGHPDVDVVVATAGTQAGQPVGELYPSLAAAYPDLGLSAFDADADAGADIDVVDGLDLLFLGLPHQASMALAPRLVGRVGCVVDLSAAFRLKDASSYPAWYGFEHDQPALLAEAVYGLPERHRADLVGARLVATPGCYVTAATLALAPLLDAGLVDPVGVIVDAASGVSGAGRGATASNAFCTVDENFVAYGLLDHRHTPEIEQNLGAQVLFTPHLAPMNRGILATCYARPVAGADLSTALLGDVLRAAYATEPFVVAIDGSPSTKATLGSNAAHVNARFDERTGYVVALCAIDNLTKGASGGALQSANIALGLDERAGLPLVGVAP